MLAGYVVIIDDDEPIRYTMRQALELEGYQVLDFESGQSALAWFRDSASLPAVIMLDLMMPSMNGWEVATFLRADPKTKNIPIVVITALGAERVQADFAVETMQKPIFLNALYACARRYVSGEMKAAC
jgi:CheY-like chemotaxis protein